MVNQRTIKDADKLLGECMKEDIKTWPFIVDHGGVIVYGAPGVGYFANIDGWMVRAVADGGNGLGDDEVFHFTINNPLG